MEKQPTEMKKSHLALSLLFVMLPGRPAALAPPDRTDVSHPVPFCHESCLGSGRRVTGMTEAQGIVGMTWLEVDPERIRAVQILTLPDEEGRGKKAGWGGGRISWI